MLAAGASTRFGGQPKALLPVGSESIVARLARLGFEGGAERVVVVAGVHAAAIQTALQNTGAEVVLNPDWAAGRTGSVQVGLNAVSPEVDILLWPVDHPFVESETLEILQRSAERDSLSLWFVPTFRDHGGHPIVLRPDAREKIESLDVSTPLRSLIPGLGIYVRRLAVDDPGVVASVDTPEEYLTALSAWRLRQGENP